MRHPQPKQYFAANHRAVANADSIEWEEMPSFARSLVRQPEGRAPRGANDSAFMGVTPATGAEPWETTLPAALDAAPASEPFTEPLEGMSTREVVEPDVFRHFFGPQAAD